MARGTKKSYFKKKKTRNKKNILKQRRTRKRKGGKGDLMCYQLHPRTRDYLRRKLGRCLINGQVAASDNEEYIKHHLTTISSADGPRKRGWVTTYLGKKKTISEMNDLNTMWAEQTERHEEARQRKPKTEASEKAPAKAKRKGEAARRQKKTDAESVKQMVAPSSTLHRSRSSSPRRSSISSSASPDDEWDRYYEVDYGGTY